MRRYASADPTPPTTWPPGHDVHAAAGLTDTELPRTTDELIAEILRRCLHLFDVQHARFVRPLDADSWVVHTRRGGTTLTHVADHAEVAMAWMVGLGRQPLLVNRPRVAAIDGTKMRPISARRYLGIPVICQDRLVGVLEWSGDLHANIEGTLFASIAWLNEIAERLVFDPALEGRISLTGGTVCIPGQRVLHGRSVDLRPEDWPVLLALGSGCTLTDLAERLNTPQDTVAAQVDDLVLRGLIELLDPHDAPLDLYSAPAQTPPDRSHA